MFPAPFYDVFVFKNLYTKLFHLWHSNCINFLTCKYTCIGRTIAIISATHGIECMSPSCTNKQKNEKKKMVFFVFSFRKQEIFVFVGQMYICHIEGVAVTCTGQKTTETHKLFAKLQAISRRIYLCVLKIDSILEHFAFLSFSHCKTSTFCNAYILIHTHTNPTGMRTLDV